MGQCNIRENDGFFFLKKGESYFSSSLAMTTFWISEVPS